MHALAGRGHRIVRGMVHALAGRGHRIVRKWCMPWLVEVRGL